MINIKNEKKSKAVKYLSLTLEQGSIISSLAAIRATQPSTIWLRYNIGVLPINYPKQETRQQNWNMREKATLKALIQKDNTSVTSFLIAHLSSMLCF